MSRAVRYVLDTEHIRGEPRLWWVADSQNKWQQVSNIVTDKRKAERECKQLNAGKVK